MSRRSSIWAGALAAVALWPAAADANTTCVSATEPGCFTTVSAAVKDANSGPKDDDRIEIRAGEHAVPATIDHDPAAGALEIVGAGRDRTVVLGGASISDPAFDLGAGAVLSDLTLELPAGADRGGIRIAAGLVARVAVRGPMVTGASAGLNLQDGADAEDVLVDLPRNGTTAGIAIHDYDTSTLRDVDVTADYGVVALGTGSDATTVVHGARILATHVALWANGSSLVADGVIADVTGDPEGVAVRAGTAAAPATLKLKHATLRAPATGVGVDVAPPPGSSATATVRETVVAGPAVHARVANDAGTPARLDVAWSALDPARVATGGTGTNDRQIILGPGNITPADPEISPTRDPIPSWSSPLVDAGEPGLAALPDNVLDVLGRPRVQDGNGDGVARRDIGAIELPPQGSGAPPAPNPGPPSAQPAPPAPPARPGAEQAAPRVPLPTFRAPKGGLRMDGRGRVALRLSCAASCRGILTLKSARAIVAREGARKRVATLGSATYALAPGKAKVVRVRVGAQMRSYLRRRGRLGVAAHFLASGANPRAVPFTLRSAVQRRR